MSCAFDRRPGLTRRGEATSVCEVVLFCCCCCYYYCYCSYYCCCYYYYYYCSCCPPCHYFHIDKREHLISRNDKGVRVQCNRVEKNWGRKRSLLDWAGELCWQSWWILASAVTATEYRPRIKISSWLKTLYGCWCLVYWSSGNSFEAARIVGSNGCHCFESVSSIAVIQWKRQPLRESATKLRFVWYINYTLTTKRKQLEGSKQLPEKHVHQRRQLNRSKP